MFFASLNPALAAEVNSSSGEQKLNMGESASWAAFSAIACGFICFLEEFNWKVKYHGNGRCNSLRTKVQSNAGTGHESRSARVKSRSSHYSPMQRPRSYGNEPIAKYLSQKVQNHWTWIPFHTIHKKSKRTPARWLSHGFCHIKENR